VNLVLGVDDLCVCDDDDDDDESVGFFFLIFVWSVDFFDIRVCV